jgi:predicted TIM-barrel fold metal-dependent hydrolase
VIDCDVHCAPASIAALEPYLDEYWRDYLANAELVLSPSLQGAYPAGLLAAEVPGDVETLRAAVLADADAAVLTCLTPFESSSNVYFEAALCRAINDWLREQWLEREPRLRASLTVPVLDPDAAAEEIDRLGSHPGFTQVLLPVRTQAPYGNRRYAPIHAAAERHGLALALHAWGRPGNAPTPSGFARTYLQDYLANSQIVAQAHVTSLVAEGVFDRHPGLRVVLAECGFAWLPFLLWRFDKDWKAIWREVPWVRERPSAYVRRHVRATTTPAQLPRDPAVLARLPALLHADELLLYASDYPHRHGGTADPLLAQLDDAGRHAVLHANAAELHGIAA